MESLEFFKETLFYIRKKKYNLFVLEGVDKKGDIFLIELNKKELDFFKKKYKPILFPIKNSYFDIVQISLTRACQLNCSHCYLGGKDNFFLSFDKAKSLLLALRDLGVKKIEYSGGEPTLSPDFDKIVSFGKKLGFYQTLLTNGFHFSKENFRAILKSFDKIRISLDGPPELHNKIRQKERAFENAFSNLKKLFREKKKKKLNFSLEVGVCLVSETSLKDLFWLYLKVKDYIDVFFLSPVVPQGRSSNLNIFDLRELYLRYLDFLSFFKRKELQKFGFDVSKIKRRKKVYFYCPAGRDLIYVSERGAIYPCPLLIFPELKIGEIDLERDFTKEKIVRKLIESKRDNDVWRKKISEYKKICSGCKKCIFPCPAYRYPLGLSKNPWCSLVWRDFRIFDSWENFDILRHSLGDRQKEIKDLFSLVKRFSSNKVKSVLELGCGDGLFLQKFSSLFKKLNFVLGVDRSEALVSKARSLFGKNGFLHFQLIDCFDKNFPKKLLKKKVDLAFSVWSSVLGYGTLQKDRIFLKNVYEVLNKNGMFFIETISGSFVFSHFKEKSETVFNYRNRKIKISEKRVWLSKQKRNILTFFDIYINDKLSFSTYWVIKLYTLEELIKLLEKIGFKILWSEESKRLKILAIKK